MTPSAHIFNITIPSLETIISREVLWKSSVILHIVGVNKPASEFLVNYGVTDALSAFPLHSLVSTMTATINNNTVSMNVQETLPLLLRMLDDEEICTYDDMTPTTLDYLANYADAVDAMPFTIDTVAASGFAGIYVCRLQQKQLQQQQQLVGARRLTFHIQVTC